MLSCLSGSVRSRILPVLSAALPVLASPPAVAQDARPEETIDLPAISVTANLVETPLSQVGSAVTVITAKELERQKIELVSDALRQVPGLAVNRTGPLGQLTQVRIRGAEGNQTLVMIDGIKVNDPAAGSEFDFAHLLTDDIERIEVLRGPQSALYGSDAIGGVINIVTRRGAPGVQARAKAEGGSFGTFHASGSVSGGGETYDVILGGSGFRTDGVSAASRRLGNTEKDGYENGTVFAKAHYDVLPHLELSGVARYTAFRTDLDTEMFYPEYGHTGPVDAEEDVKGELFFGRAEAKLMLLDGHWEQRLGLGLTDQARDYRDLALDSVTSTLKGRTLKADYRSTYFFDTPSLLDASHNATFAVQHEEASAVSKSAWSSFDRTIETTGFVGEYQAQLLDDLTLTGSVRYDDNSLFKDAVTYRLTGAYLITRTGTKIRGSYGTGVKNPTLFELYGYAPNYRGNPDLKPERGTGWDFGIDQALLGGRAMLDVTYFNQRIEDLIVGAGQTSTNLPGKSRIEGVEVGLTAELLANLSVRASYTFTDGKDADGAELVRRPRHIASLNVNYRFLDDRANLNLGIDYNGKQKDWVFSEFYDETYVVELDAYTLVSLAGSYRVAENAEIYGRVENLLDEDYYEVWGYGTPGFNGVAGVRVSF